MNLFKKIIIFSKIAEKNNNSTTTPNSIVPFQAPNDFMSVRDKL